MASTTYVKWLKDHLNAAKIRYEELCRLDDQEFAVGGTSEFYEQAHQMFGYVAALEKCLREAQRPPTLKGGKTLAAPARRGKKAPAK